MAGGDGYKASVKSPGGGGGSDCRVGKDSLFSRVIVAGGGGGAGQGVSYGPYAGGYGGGVNGETRKGYDGRPGGDGGTGSSGWAFGIGGPATQYGSGGGGGGWYGGGCGDNTAPGGGGSGYVYTAGTASQYPSGCLLNSLYYLSNAQTIAGNQSFPAPGGDNETGHSGNGYARIALVE